MRNVTMIFILFFLTIISNSGFTAPIPASELFRSANDFSYELNPSSKYIAHHFFREDGRDVIELIDIKKDKKGNIFLLKVKADEKILNYFWIDEDTIYVSYYLNNKKSKRIFIDIDFTKFESGDSDYTKSFEIKAKGTIIDPLKGQNNVFLFQRIRSGSAKVYKLTTEQLLASNFVFRNKFRPGISDAVSYFTDESGNVRFGFNLDMDKQEVVYWYLDKQENEWIEFHRFGNNKSYFEPVSLLGDNKLAVITNAETDLRVLMEYDLKSKKFGQILYQHDKYDIYSAQISAETRKVLSVSYSEHGRLKTQYFSDKDSRSNSAIKKLLPGKQFFTVSQNKGSSIKILVGFASDDSGGFYWFDSDSETIIKLNAIYKKHNNFKFTKTELLTINNVQGRPIEAFLTRPENGNGVLLVNPHGGPIGIRDDDDFNRKNQYFASRGYSILSVNFRGSIGLGKKFMDAGRGQFGKSIESDITSVVNEIKNKYKFKYTCSMGASYGGYSALVLVAQNPEDYDCAVARYGVYDLPLLFNRSNKKMKDDFIDAITSVIGNENDLREEQSPINFADKINVPVLLIAGEEDETSGFEQSNRMKYRLKQLNKDVETMFYTKTGHGYHSKWLWDWHEHAYIDDFIRRKLKIKHPVTKEWKKAIADEAMIISDGFEFENKVKIDREKAFRYVEIAAEQDLPRAVHNLAAYYNSTNAVEKDFDKALRLYARASKLGWANSSEYLGEVYRDGKETEKSLEKSYQYFEAAYNQNHKDAWFNVLRAKCSGWGVERNIDYCISGLTTDDNNESKLSVEQEKVLMEDILLKPWPSESFKNKFLSQLAKMNIHNIDNKNDFIGEEINPYGKGDNVATIKNGRFIFNRVGSRFILDYYIDDDSDSKREFALKVKWIVSDVENKAIVYEGEHVFFTKAGSHRVLRLDSSNIKYKVEGIINLEIKNLEDVVLYSEKARFNLKEDT